jgi:hypothetical protein
MERSFGHLRLEIGIYLGFEVWNLVLEMIDSFDVLQAV